MKYKNEYAQETFKNMDSLSYSALFHGILIGIFGGCIVALYRYMLTKVSGFIYPVYISVLESPLKIVLTFIILALAGLIVGYIIRIEPMITGSGIPQVQGIIIGKMKLHWPRVIILKFIGGIISLGAGLSLGREGPSVQIGAASGMAVARIFKCNKVRQKYMLTFGSSAGLAAAFNAPLAGVLFALEELQKSFSAIVFVGTMIAAVTADFISKLIFGTSPVFNLGEIKNIPLEYFPFLLVLGAVLGLTGVIFNKSLLFTVKKYEKLFKLPIVFKPVISFLLAGLIGMTMPILLGGGHELIIDISENLFSLKFLIFLLILKFLFTLISYCSSSPGGIFLPLLSIGAVIGCITGKVFCGYLGMDSDYINTFIVLAMAGYFTSVVKSPITGIILISEMTGGFESFLSLSVVCITAYLVSNLLKGKPVYEMLLKNSLTKGVKTDLSEEKTILEIPVGIGTVAANKKIMYLDFPEHMLLISIKRQGEEIIPNGSTRICSGDILSVYISEKDISAALDYFLREE